MSDEPQPPPIFLVRPVAGLVALLAALLPLRLARAAMESSFWLDEAYSALLAAMPVAQMIDATAVDAHPPLYYLALKGWLAAWRALGVEGVLAGRSLGAVAWVGASVVAWWGLRRLLGAAPGTLAAWAVAACPAFGHGVREMRNYALGPAALMVCFVVLLVLALAPPRSRGKQAGLWALHGACAAIAAWTHLLCAPVLASLGFLWIGLACWKRDRGFLVGGLLAHGLAALSFVPWMLVLRGQLEYLGTVPTPWMTDPTAGNLARVFLVWIPLGSVWGAGWSTPLWSVVLGGAGLVAVGAGTAWAASKARVEGERAAAFVALAGVGLAVANVLLLWALMRLEVARVFHGPRYPMLVAPIAWAGAAGAAAWIAARAGDARALALLAPLLLASAIGQAWTAQNEATGGLAGGLRALGEAAPPPGAVVHVFPPALAPFHARTLAAFDARPVAELPGAAPGDAWLLDLKNLYMNLERPGDHVLKALVGSGRLAESFDAQPFPAGMPEFALYHLRGFDPTRLGALGANAMQPPNLARPPKAIAVAMPDEQRFRDGWLLWAADVDGRALRWARREEVTLRLDGPLPPGNYRIFVEGSRPPRPTETATLSMELAGVGAAWTQPLGPGPFRVMINVQTARAIESPRLVLRHPTWPEDPARHQYLTDELSFLLARAWVEKVE